MRICYNVEQKKLIKNEFDNENLMDNTDNSPEEEKAIKNKKLLQHCVAGASKLVV